MRDYGLADLLDGVALCDLIDPTMPESAMRWQPPEVYSHTTPTMSPDEYSAQRLIMVLNAALNGVEGVTVRRATTEVPSR